MNYFVEKLFCCYLSDRKKNIINWNENYICLLLINCRVINMWEIIIAAVVSAVESFLRIYNDIMVKEETRACSRDQKGIYNNCKCAAKKLERLRMRCNEHAARLICARQRSERVPQHVQIIPVSLINIRSLRIFLPFYLILSIISFVFFLHHFKLCIHGSLWIFVLFC